jgi:hypothetical protein
MIGAAVEAPGEAPSNAAMVPSLALTISVPSFSNEYPLVEYLAGQLMLSDDDRMAALREYFPNAKKGDERPEQKDALAAENPGVEVGHRHRRRADRGLAVGCGLASTSTRWSSTSPGS